VRAHPRPSRAGPSGQGPPRGDACGAPQAARRMEAQAPVVAAALGLGAHGGGATLRLRVVATALLLLLAALLLALRNLLLDSLLQLRRALGAWQVTPQGGLP